MKFADQSGYNQLAFNELPNVAINFGHHCESFRFISVDLRTASLFDVYCCTFHCMT